LARPSAERSDEHPFVRLVTSAARVWFEHASLEQKPVNQVLKAGTTEAFESPSKIGTSPAAFIH